MDATDVDEYTALDSRMTLLLGSKWSVSLPETYSIRTPDVYKRQDIDGQRRALFQLGARLRVGADDLAFLHVVAVFLNDLALDVVRCQRDVYKRQP